MEKQSRLSEFLSLNTIVGITPEMELFRNISQYELGDRLFLELGVRSASGSWIREGQFMEVKKPENFIYNGDPRWNDLEWMDHHNFMIIKLNHRDRQISTSRIEM